MSANPCGIRTDHSVIILMLSLYFSITSKAVRFSEKKSVFMNICVHFSLQILLENIFLFKIFKDLRSRCMLLLMKNLFLPVYVCVCVHVFVLCVFVVVCCPVCVCVCLCLLYICMLNLWWTNWHWGRFFRVVTFPLSILISPIAPHLLIILSPMLH
jgi:hypothetical protein